MKKPTIEITVSWTGPTLNIDEVWNEVKKLKPWGAPVRGDEELWTKVDLVPTDEAIQNIARAARKAAPGDTDDVGIQVTFHYSWGTLEEI